MKLTKSSVIIFFSIFIVFFIYGGIILWNIWPIDSKALGQAGVFGDSFGVLTSLFSGLAFAGLIVTIWQQQEDIALTRRDIKDQHFENMLFRMLEIHNNIVMDIDLRRAKADEDFKKGEIISTGRDCFRDFHGNISSIYKGIKNKHPNKDENEILKSTYEIFWRHRKSDLGHYFRYLYNIFKLIHESHIEKKQKYINIVRAQLSDYELAILFYNCNSKHGSERFKPLVEEYHLLNNLPMEFLLSQKHKELYLETAYT